MRQSNRKLQRTRKLVAVVLVNLTVLFVLLEVSLRIANPSCRILPERSATNYGLFNLYFEPHPVFGYFHIPNWRGTLIGPNTTCLDGAEYKTVVNINRLGLRAPDTIGYDKSAGVQRVLVVGDSFTEGFGVEIEEAFVTLLEENLNNSGKVRPVQVVNGGVGGYSLEHVLKFLSYEGIKYKPDLILYAFYPDDVGHPSQLGRLYDLDVDGHLVELPPVMPSKELPFSKQITSFLNNQFYTYRLFNFVLLRLFPPSVDLSRYSVSAPEVLDRSWSLAAAMLQEMQAVAQSVSADLMIVYLPEVFQVIDARWEQIAASSAEPLLRDMPNALLRERIPSEVTYFDITPSLRSYHDPSALYYQIDLHFTPEGHHLTAKLIADHILERGLLEKLSE